MSSSISEPKCPSAEPTPRPGIDRRTVLKAGSSVVVVVATPPAIGSASAATQYDATLSVDATIPTDTAVQVTVTEYEEDADSAEVGADTVAIDDPEAEYDISIPAESQYYDFEVELGSNADNQTPEVSILTLVIEEVSLNEGGSGSIIEWVFSDSDSGFLDFSWSPFTSDSSSDDDGDGGLFDFDFDFWPFN